MPALIPDSLVTVSYEPDDAPDPLLITNDDLQEISRRAWSDPAYGQTAADILAMAHPGRPQDIGEARDFTYNHIEVADPGWCLYERTGVSTTQLEQDARRSWAATHLPFVPLITTDVQDPSLLHSDPNYPVRIRLQAGPVVRPLLARFVSFRGYPDHTVPGSIGMALDVLNIAAFGTYAVDRNKANPGEEMLPYSELLARLRETGASEDARGKITERIQSAIPRQILYPQPEPAQAAVFGGEVRRTIHRRWKYGSVALSSLGSVAASFKRGTAPRRALEEIIAA